VPEQVTGWSWLFRVAAGDFTVAAAVVATPRRVVVVDTLAGPAEAAAVAAFARERAAGGRLTVVLTHHHWDHAWGTAAFAGAEVVAQRQCPRLLAALLAGGAEDVPPPPPEGVPLPTMTFGDRLSLDDAQGSPVHLIHAPGHSEDSLVVFVPGERLLLAGDVVEWPLPSFSQRDGAEAWVATLRRLKQLPVTTVVPSHGPVGGKELIDATQRYVETVVEAVRAAKARGVGRGEVDLPVERAVAPGVEVGDAYRQVHAANLLWAWDDA